MKLEKIEEQEYYGILELFDNNYELVIKCFKKFCRLKATPTVLRRVLSDIRFYDIGTKKRNYDTIKPAIEKLKQCNQAELYNWIEVNHTEEEFKEGVEVTEQILQAKKEDLGILGFSEKQLEMICYREIAAEEKYQEIISSKEKKIQLLEQRLNSRRNIKIEEYNKELERLRKSNNIYRSQKKGLPLSNFPKEFL